LVANKAESELLDCVLAAEVWQRLHEDHDHDCWAKELLAGLMFVDPRKDWRTAWATGLKSQNNGAVLLCVDTWTGAVSNWLAGPKFAAMSRISGGQPHLFEQFMTRIINANLTYVVLPRRIPSISAARHLWMLQYHVDMIYLS
jgi:hypothetical protein